MTLHPEMTAFIVENVELIEQAYENLGEVDTLLIANMNKFAKKLLEERNIFDIYLEDWDLHFSRSKWEKNEKDEPLLSFCLDCQGENTDKSWLMVLGGKAPGTMAGIYCWYDWTAKGIKTKAWKSFIRDFFVTHESLHDNGFAINDNGTAIMKPFNLDLGCLKDNFLSPEKCFEPLVDAIDAIHDQIKIFDALSKEAKEFASKK